MEALEVLEISKDNLQKQYDELNKERNDLSEKILLVKGALMWVNQTLNQIKEDNSTT